VPESPFEAAIKPVEDVRAHGTLGAAS